MAETLTLAQKLAKAQGEFGVVTKNKKNDFQNYKYSDLMALLDAVQPALAANGLSHTTTFEEPIFSEHGTVTIKGIVTLSDGKESLVTDCWGFSVWKTQSKVDDKAVYKAMTGARKNGYFALLGVASGDEAEKVVNQDGDADALKQPHSPEGRPLTSKPKPQAPPTQAQEQLSDVLKIVKEYGLDEVSLLQLTEVGTLKGISTEKLSLVHDRLHSAIRNKVIAKPEEQGAPQNG